ncbi:glycosyltransferase 61 family protein [Roseomonas rosulenta]|uniref:glycosyltransferase 61 family protein n=1 Tax=Roseomonas rosulenta TaxID=2748667 RepID=UPI0018DF0EFB|nr:glycosyltransferase 61 family protein [Roseomonas rosulenta]
MDKEARPPRPAPATVRDAARRGDWAEALRLAALLDPRRVGPGIVSAVVNAALVEGRAEDVAAAAAFAIAARIQPSLRVVLAWQMAQAGQLPEGLSLLLADPATYIGGPGHDPQQMPVVLRLLQRAAQAPTVAPAMRATAAALAERLLGASDRKPEPAGIPFGPEGARSDLASPPTVILAAPGVPEAIAQEAGRAMATFETIAARLPPPEVSVLRDVFVDRGGLVWDRDGRPVLTYQRPVPTEGIAAMASAPTIPAAVMAVEPHGNLYHWFAEWLPSLAWRLNDAAGTLPLLLSDRAPAFVGESLDLADAGAAPRIAVGDALFVERLFIAQRNLALMAHRAAYGGLLERIAARADAMAGPAMGSGPLYISRRDTPKRPLGNEAALEAALAERGFEAALFSRTTLGHNIARLRRAPCVVAPHGAGLALLLAARRGTAVVELIPATRASLTLRTCFAKVSRVAGLRHHLWLERPDLVTAAWAADLPGVLAAVEAAGG